jgi:hypothetical protein
MYRRYTLKAIAWHKPDIDIEVDIDAGQIMGDGADLVKDLAAAAIKDREITGHPFPTTFTIKDPLRNLGELTVLLGQYWQLSPELQAAYPVIPDDDPETITDGEGREIQIPLLH